MEYFISNAPFTGATKIASHLYIKGDFREIDDFSYLLEGYLIDEQTKSSISGDSSKDTCQCLSHSLPENVSGTGMGDMGLRRQRL